MPEKCTDNPRDCPMSARIEALERANEQHGKTHREIFEQMHKVDRDNAVQDAHYKTISKKLDEISATVKTMADKPGKRWESMVEKAIWAVCAAVIAWFLARMGL